MRYQGIKFWVGKRVDEEVVKEGDLSEVIRDLFCPTSGDYPDTALLFFSGHGHRNDDKKVFLATSDTNRKNKWGITLNCLHQLLLESKVRRQIVWLDCCHAGELINFNWTEEEWKEWSAKGDRFLVAACAAYNKAYAVDGHGLLTRVLLEALQEELERGLISSWTVARFIRNCQDNRLKNQNPLVKHYGDEISFWQGKKIKKVTYKEIISLEEVQKAPSHKSTATSEEKSINPSEKLSESKLYDALLRLDYDDQDTVFKYCLRKHKIGCFRIEYTRHGGQGFLLNRFIQYATQNTGIEELVIPLGRKIIKSDCSSILKAIATFVGAEKPYQSSTIAAKISQRLSSQNLIVILDDFQLLPLEERLKIHKFWQELIDCLGDSQNFKKRLLMFWIERPAPTVSGIDSLIEEEDITASQILSYIEEDPEGILKKFNIKGYPQCNCHEILKARYLGDSPAKWSELAQRWQVPFGSLTVFASRKCIPLLREIAGDLGYRAETSSQRPN